MKWDMEIEEIEAVLEKIWDLHDKLSDAIHSISRAHFLNSIKALRKSDKKKLFNDVVVGDDNRTGFVFVKDFRIDDGDSAIHEAKSLNAIRTALENLEDQLEFFHTVQIQQQVERDAAIARLEQSRIILALRLAEHHGKKYKVIDEALAFVGDVHDASHYVSPENLYRTPNRPSGQNLVSHKGKYSNKLIKVLVSSFNYAKKSLNFDHMGGILSNVAIFAVSMIAMMHIQQLALSEHSGRQEDNINNQRNPRKNSQLEGPSFYDDSSHLDVYLARG
ncbi:Plastid division protein PDV1 [Hibiscus syriacus]|uniref:Plastid division protein PDV1 n=1 Tax=Hibiscus syriacus TaxID=106335 RepID=A0A6A3DAX4_HIBSY|nr:plastid division protein PDV1-like [Hibiscus syriacus]KAE8736411.1 Plastid division protein PDV1 [Hibiscus syriacus]